VHKNGGEAIFNFEIDEEEIEFREMVSHYF
jgi:hypothetical protein